MESGRSEKSSKLQTSKRCIRNQTYLTVESVEAGPDKLIVVRDFVDNSSETADTVLNHLRKRKGGIMLAL